MGGHLSKEETDDQSYSDEFTNTFIDQLIQSTERDESNTEAEPDPIQSEKLKPIKNHEFFEICKETQKICINIVKIGNKVHVEGKAKRRIERDDLNRYVKTIAKDSTTLLGNLDEISNRLEGLSNKVDKKLITAERWGKILGIILNVVYAVLSATMYTILVMSTIGISVLPDLDVAIWSAVKACLISMRRKFKLFRGEKSGRIGNTPECSYNSKKQLGWH
ncbi:uncharacterized protein LOC122065987 [Macadamia integrifolia]|uniref:uncharacterized protein LOC122065987 n=1 Tax=Macadamia integrifolia TaxID=60698 RepID=UPI001C4E498F|nr:uncharacterized protein LOC122065987 [Macadamia integrifolia]